MAEKRVWRGIQSNFALFQGKIIADPVFNGGFAFLTLRTVVIQRDKNGQTVEVDQEIPLMVEPGSPQMRVIEGYIKKDRKLQAWCSYKSWEIENHGKQHAFVIKQIDLGDKPFEGSSTNSVPPLPD